MSKLEFKAEDFQGAGSDIHSLAKRANKRLAEMLADAPKVRGMEIDGRIDWASGGDPDDTHRARLVNVERIDERD